MCQRIAYSEISCFADEIVKCRILDAKDIIEEAFVLRIDVLKDLEGPEVLDILLNWWAFPPTLRKRDPLMRFPSLRRGDIRHFVIAEGVSESCQREQESGRIVSLD